MEHARFEWSAIKNRENQAKHHVSFALAQEAFLDPYRVIVEDAGHSARERRLYCIGRVGDGILTVRFTFRGNIIRIFGAGYWRNGKRAYEKENKHSIHGRADG
jgi:uncharacterized DUF497 family protein